MNKLVLLTLITLLGLVSSSWTYQESHSYSPSVSKQIADGVKQEILAKISTFTDKTFADRLVADLNQKDNSKRSLKQVSLDNAKALLAIFYISDPVCDKSVDAKNFIIGDKLSCLNIIWKSYLPK